MSGRYLNSIEVLAPKKQQSRIGMVAHIAETLGFKYFIWKEIIYQKENDMWMRTPFSRVNIQ